METDLLFSIEENFVHIFFSDFHADLCAIIGSCNVRENQMETDLAYHIH